MSFSYIATPLLCSALLLSACAGRPANPVPMAQMGDESRSCQAIAMEMDQINADIQKKIPETDKTRKNVILGVTGLFFLVPWFFMDFTESEQIEIDALHNRYTRLNSIAIDKKCKNVGDAQ